MRTRYANVVATLALVASLGTGGAYAAGQLARGSVTTREVKDGSIARRDLAPAARSPRGTLTRANLRDAVSEVIADPASGINITVHGEKGEAGPAGTQGPAGPAGQPGIASVVVRKASSPAAAGADAAPVVECQAGELALGGGGGLDRAGGVVSYSTPLEDGRGWSLHVANAGGGDAVATVYAVCAKVGA